MLLSLAFLSLEKNDITYRKHPQLSSTSFNNLWSDINDFKTQYKEQDSLKQIF